MTIEIESLLRDSLPARAEPSLELAHFGKHPAWEDHMEHLGAETRSILTVKRVLYVQGIGEILNRGTWKTLEDEGSALSFDHEFIWSRGADAVLGILTASRDAKGRELYPLVAVCHLRGHPLPSMIQPVFAEVRESSSRLQATQSRDMAKRLMQGIQGRFRKLEPRELGLGQEERQAFLDAEEMEPDRQGFRRILHVAMAAAEYGKQAHLQIRVPLCHEESESAYILWLAFLRLIFGVDTLLLLIRQRQATFMDIIVGPPRADDFYCLRAGNKTIAMTHEAPYSISEQAQAGAEPLFAKFIAGESPADNTSKFARFFQRLRS